MRRVQPERIILNGVQTNGFGTAMSIQDFLNKTITIVARGLTTGQSILFKFAISQSDDCPTFSSTAAYDNRWDYVAVRNKDDKDLVDGSTGITISSTDTAKVRNYLIDDDDAKWINVSATLTDTVNSYAYAYLSCANDSD